MGHLFQSCNAKSASQLKNLCEYDCMSHNKGYQSQPSLHKCSVGCNFERIMNKKEGGLTENLMFCTFIQNYFAIYSRFTLQFEQHCDQLRGVLVEFLVLKMH